MLRGSVLVTLAGMASVAQAVIPVVGRKSGIDSITGAIPARRNINDLYSENGKEYVLYTRAVQAMQDEDPSNPKSWFQIMGIHGYPPLPYDNEPDTTTGIVGYCPHGEEIFATWHRHYLTLYEQTLGEYAMDIAATYPESERQEWQDAAERLRSPFWDWAGNTDIPEATLHETITIIVPSADGQSTESKEVPNPLWSYNYPASVMNGTYGWTPKLNHTARCPDADGNPHPENGSAQLANRGIKNAVYNVFTRSKDFTSAMTMRGRGASIESPHGSIHVYAGCGAEFAGVAESAFDPLFMLHHTEVDRLIALWQAVYPDQAMFNYTGYPSYGTWSIGSGETVNPSTPLGPFYRNETSYHDSTTALRTWDYGYVYPGMQPWNRSTSEMRTDIIELVNNLYDPDTSDDVTVPERRRSLKRTAITEYYAQVQVQVDNFPRPCSLQLYIGDILAGTYTLMGRPTTGLMHGEISLQRGIKLAGLQDSVDMMKDLGEKMVIKFEKPDGTVLPANQTGNYTIQLEKVSVVKPSKKTELPEFGLGQFFDIIPKLINIDLDFLGNATNEPSFSLNILGLELDIGGGAKSASASSAPTVTSNASPLEALSGNKAKTACSASKSAAYGTGDAASLPFTLPTRGY